LKALEKVALLIGNEGGNLEKPVDDILLLERKLTSVDFKVIPLINLGFDDMLEALKMFSDLLKKGVYGNDTLNIQQFYSCLKFGS